MPPKMKGKQAKLVREQQEKERKEKEESDRKAAIVQSEMAAAVEMYKEPPTEFADNIKLFLEREMKYSKTNISKTWGRQIISAIDIDDCIALYEVYSGKRPSNNYASIDIDAQSCHTGYGEYLWTPHIHKYLGEHHHYQTCMYRAATHLIVTTALLNNR